jgi:hypothetical protein
MPRHLTDPPGFLYPLSSILYPLSSLLSPQALFLVGLTPPFLVLAGLALPKDPLKILPFFVFLSPLPIVIVFSGLQK